MSHRLVSTKAQKNRQTTMFMRTVLNYRGAQIISLQTSSQLWPPLCLLHHMSSGKHCEGTHDWHVEVCAPGDATEYCQSHTVSASLCKPTYTRCDLTALQATPVQGGNNYIW